MQEAVQHRRENAGPGFRSTVTDFSGGCGDGVGSLYDSRYRDAGAPMTGGVLRAIELFCGIGGFAAATAGSNLKVVAAMDQDTAAIDTYRLNFPGHPVRRVDLAKVAAWDLTAGGVDFWWMSPPCQPYCERGVRRDIEDPRARSFLRMLELLGTIPENRLPCRIALENVQGFVGSQAHARLLEQLAARGYNTRELLLCPTELGVPSRRPRYYLAASLEPLAAPEPSPNCAALPLKSYLDPCPAGDIPPELLLDQELVARFGKGMRMLDPDDPAAYTTCFTSGYGRSLMAAGSYLSHTDGVRRFAPEEIARLLHFPAEFRFPESFSLRQRWHLVGNSLSVVAVRELLRSFPSVRFAPGQPF